MACGGPPCCWQRKVNRLEPFEGSFDQLMWTGPSHSTARRIGRKLMQCKRKVLGSPRGEHQARAFDLHTTTVVDFFCPSAMPTCSAIIRGQDRYEVNGFCHLLNLQSNRLTLALQLVY